MKSLGPVGVRTPRGREWAQRFATRDCRLDSGEIERMRAFFAPPPYEQLQDVDVIAQREASSKAWYRYNTRPHKVAGYRVVFLSLKAHGEAPGDMTAEQMDGVADLAERCSFGLIRASHDQNLLLADVRQGDLYELWRALDVLKLATPNIGTLTDMICCPGLDFCSLANATSIPVAKQIQAHFSDLDYLYDLGEIQIKMSGCMNACGHHHVGHIGILGVDKHGEGGTRSRSAVRRARTRRSVRSSALSVPQAAVAGTIQKLIDVYVERRHEEERFVDTVRRIGVEPFQDRVYGES